MLTLAPILFSGRSDADESSLKVWWTDYGSAYRLAEKEKKPLLVVFEAVDGPARVLQGSSPWQQSPASSLLGPYILCRINISTPAGRELARTLQRMCRPDRNRGAPCDDATI